MSRSTDRLELGDLSDLCGFLCALFGKDRCMIQSWTKILTARNAKEAAKVAEESWIWDNPFVPHHFLKITNTAATIRAKPTM